MKSNDYEFLICSPIEQEKLVCEIYYKSEIIAEISQEKKELMLEIYPSQTSEWWKIPLVQFQKILEDAKIYLINQKDEIGKQNP